MIAGSSMADGRCPYCLAAPRQGTFATYKHVWTMYRCCGTMRRSNKQRYPGDWVVRALSRTRLGTKIANRVVPQFMRRAADDRQYAVFGRAFDDVFGPPVQDAFLDMKRKRYLREADEMLELFKRHGIDFADRSVLDVSGGPGSFAWLIKDAVRKISVTEFDPVSVADMQEKLPGIRVFQADLNAAWTDDEVFDVILYRSCVYFCFDLRAHLAAIAPRVSPGGYIFISTNTPTLGNALRWQFLDYTHHVLYHPDVVKNALEDRGFAVVASGPTDFYHHYLAWYTGRERVYYRWGLWNLLRPNGPRRLDARSAWVVARKSN